MLRYISLSVLAVAAAGTLGFWMTRSAPMPGEAALPFAAQAQEAAELDTSTIVDMAIGEEDAPVTIIEYASFTCPHCANFHTGVFKQLKENYVDTGKVRFIHREVYFDRFGLWAGMVARCGGEMRYFGIVDMIYEQQQEWTKGEPAQIVDNLRRIGRTAGLTNEQMDVCLSDGTKAQTLVAWYQENAEADGVSSTPTFVIDGRPYSNMPYADFEEIIDGQLGG